MNFTPDFLDEIRARLPVSEVVGQRVKLRKQGREWRGLSPFNAERTPSFYVNDPKGFYHDFSSGKHGDIFTFLRDTEGLSFPEAVERLANMAGLAMPRESPEARAADQARAGLREALEWAAAFFEASLQSREGARARGYLADRGLSGALQREFRIGYAPGEKFALRDALALKGLSVEVMIEAGLLIHGEDIAVPYDRFRDRVMFPIHDRAGRAIAFGGRALDKNAQAKYLNSPETPLFHKGATLYNHHRARKAAHERGQVIAVEGYVDAISVSGAGFPQVVAPLGTALTPDQCALLWKMAPEPILCFDGDKAGRKAAFRAIDTALPLLGPGQTLRFALLPEGQDPDDLARSGGAEALQTVFDAALPLVDLLWTREVEALPLDTPEHRAGLERRFDEKTRMIADESLRRHYREEIQRRLARLFGRERQAKTPWVRRAPAGPQRAGAGRWREQRPLLGEAGAPPFISASLARSPLLAKGQVSASPREAMILLILLNHPALLARHCEEVAELELSSPALRRLRDFLVGASGETFDSREALLDAVDGAGLREARGQVEGFAAISSLWCVSATAANSDADEALQQALTLHRRTHALHQALRQAQQALADAAQDEAAAERSLAHLRDIQAQLASIEGVEATSEGFGGPSGRNFPEG